MREALMTVLAVCVAGACADSIMAAAENGGQSIGKYVRFVIVLIVISAVFFPAVNHMRNEMPALSFFDGDRTFECGSFETAELVKRECRRRLEEKVSANLCEKYELGIKSPEVRIELGEEKSGDTLTLSILRVLVVLPNSSDKTANIDAEEVTAYVGELTGCGTVIVSPDKESD